MRKITLTSLLTLTALATFAHPGHTHIGNNLEQFIHFGKTYYLPIIIGLVAIYFAVKVTKQIRRRNEQ